MKLKRYTPCPMLQQHGPFDPCEIKDFRKEGLICMGSYANDRWYIFHSRKARVTPRVPQPAPTRTMCEKVCAFIGKHRRG